MFISGYQTERPELTEYLTTEQNAKAMELWEKTKVSYPVEDEKPFHEEFICEDFKNLKENYPVKLDHLKDRMEVVENIAEATAYVRLKPIQEESEDDLWNELFNETNGVIWSNLDTVEQLINVCKSKFVLTRKTKQDG